MFTDIILIATGLGIVFASYAAAEKITDGRAKENSPKDIEEITRLIEEKQNDFERTFEHRLKNKVEEEVIKADEQLAHISNEKIMSLDEFSEQILEKIEKNHKEVVFLYNMLNEKESEMKDFVQEIDKSKIVLEELAQKELEKQKAIQQRRIQRQLAEQNRLAMEEEKRKAKAQLELEQLEARRQEQIAQETNVQKVNEQAVISEEMLALSNEISSDTVPEEENVAIEVPNFVEKEPVSVGENNNQVILDFYNQGKSIMEIAKLLGRGQGEVKLVIDLFQGAK